MTRKDFEAIASVVRDFSFTGDGRDRERLARALADELRLKNPRFNRDRFLKACGIDG